MLLGGCRLRSLLRSESLRRRSHENTMVKTAHPREHRSTLREELGLPTKVVNLLAGAGIFTLEDLIHRSWADLDSIRGLGSFTLQDIRGALAFQRLTLSLHPERPLPEQHAATEEERELPIEAIGLSASTISAIRAGGVATVGDLVDMTRADLRRIPGVGKVMVREIVAVLKEQGLALTLYFDFVKPDAPVPGDTSATIEALYYNGHLSVRALTMFRRAGISTVADLVAMTPAELRAVPGIGQVTSELVRKSLHRLGFHLAGEK